MPRYTAAYSSLINRLDEVRVLRSLASALEREDPLSNSPKIESICRGAVVLLCSHIEAYVKELGETALERFRTKNIEIRSISKKLLYHISKDFVHDIRETLDEEKVAGRIFKFQSDDSSFWDINGRLVNRVSADKFNKGFSNPTYDKVKAYLARFGFDGFHHEFNISLAADAEIIRNSLNHLVDVRTSIAHGEPSANKTPSQIRNMINDTVIFCRVVDKSFANWCKRTHCTIR